VYTKYKAKAKALGFKIKANDEQDRQAREYLWNGSSNRQAEKDVINYDFSHVQ